MTERLTTRDAELDEATHRLCAENARRWSAEAAYVALVDNSLQDLLVPWCCGGARREDMGSRCGEGTTIGFALPTFDHRAEEIL